MYHPRDIDVGFMLDELYWSNKLSDDDMQALREWTHEIMYIKYNTHQLTNYYKGKNTSKNNQNTESVDDDDDDNSEYSNDSDRELVTERQLNKRLNKLIKIILTHESSIHKNHEFLYKLIVKLMKKGYNNDFYIV